MQYRLSERARVLMPSKTLVLDAKAKAMKESGIDVVNLCAGEPDFATPEHITFAAIKALADGFTKYTPTPGIKPLREAVAKKFLNDYGLKYEWNQVVVGCGGKQSCFNVILALCQKGDEVLIPIPYWVSYPEMVKVAEATTVFVEPGPDFKITPQQLEAKITERSRLFIYNSPSNPSGVVYTPEEVAALAAVCVKHNIIIMSDEIYDKLLYDGAVHKSPASFAPDHTVIVSGLAKSYSMTGWRIGFALGPKPIMDKVEAIQSHSTSNPTSFAQMGALAAIVGPQAHLATWLEQYDMRRRFCYERLNKMEGIKCVESKGAFYLLPDISGTGLKSEEFAIRLLEEFHVAAVPAIAFGLENAIRISYACSMTDLAKAMDRMGAFVKSLKKTSNL